MLNARLARYLRIGAMIAATALCALSLYLFGWHMWRGAITADWPWLWRSGQWIAGHGLPATDMFSWTFPARDWVLYQWLFEVVVAALYDLAGPTASVIALCLVGVVIYVLVPTMIHARRGVPVVLCLTLGSLVLLPVSINLSLRPMLASCVALLLQFLLVHRLRRGATSLLTACVGIALLYALWANMHLGMTLGLVSLGLSGLGDAMDRGRSERAGAAWSVYAWLAASAFAASLLNPYGWHVYSYIAELSLKRKMNAHIHELMPPDPSNPYVMVGIGLLALFVVQWLRRPRRIGSGDALQVVVFALATAVSLRFVVWAGVYYALVAPGLWPNTSAGTHADASRAQGTLPMLLGYGLMLVAVVLVVLPLFYGPVRMADCARHAAGIRYLDRHYPADTHWFASEIVGSCTRLYAPDRRVFIDTRFDMYPEPFVMRWYGAYQHRRHWHWLFDQWQIRVVLLGNGAPLLPALERDPNWVQVWHDSQAHLFQRLDSYPGARENSAARLPQFPEIDS